MESYDFLLTIAIILISTKLFSLITKKFQMPQVVGALVAGLLLGPAVLNIVKESSFIDNVAELGVIVLMFTAGLETDIKELRNSGKASLVIATIGVLVPLGGGFLVAYIFNRPGLIASDVASSVFLQNMFIGIILTATSVSITVETLKEMGKLNTKAGNAILGAAIIDDIMGIVGLTIITSMADASVNLVLILLKIAAFFVFAGVAGFLFHLLFKKWTEAYKKDLRRFIIVAFVFCLLLAYCAEKFFGVADITGAYIAGLMIAGTKHTGYITARFDTLSYMFLTPVFFASIGIKVAIPSMSTAILMFAIVLVVIAVLTKIVGCGLGAKLCRFSNRESMQVGVGMVSRGEVALIVANKGNALGLMSTAFFGPVIIVVVVTTIIAPILLKLTFNKKSGNKPPENYESDGVTKKYTNIYDQKRLSAPKQLN